MSRAATISVLLALVIGQNPGLMCRMWCASAIASSAISAHADPTSSVTPIVMEAACPPVVGEGAVFIREDPRRDPSALAPVPVLTLATFQLQLRVEAFALWAQCTARVPLRLPPPILALRI